MIKLYAISGLGADERVFKNLHLNAELIHLQWLPAKSNEDITDYARRMSEHIDTDEEFGILGLSFGGMLAVEISKFLHPKLTILTSSVEVMDELPWYFRMVGSLGLMRYAPASLFMLPTSAASWLFGTKNYLMQFLKMQI